jgi:Domain of unknown function (DUF4282)
MEDEMEAAVPPPAPQEQQRGFFESLMDTRFDSLITPKLVTFIYVVSMIVLAVGALIAIIASFVNDAGTGVVALILAPLVALIYLIVIRLWLELIVVTFKIRDAAERVADNTR